MREIHTPTLTKASPYQVTSRHLPQSRRDRLAREAIVRSLRPAWRPLAASPALAPRAKRKPASPPDVLAIRRGARGPASAELDHTGLGTTDCRAVDRLLRIRSLRAARAVAVNARVRAFRANRVFRGAADKLRREMNAGLRGGGRARRAAVRRRRKPEWAAAIRATPPLLSRNRGLGGRLGRGVVGLRGPNESVRARSAVGGWEAPVRPCQGSECGGGPRRLSAARSIAYDSDQRECVGCVGAVFRNRAAGVAGVRGWW